MAWLTLQFQSLIWVACPTGRDLHCGRERMMSFNPSYGLHALRAVRSFAGWRRNRSFNPSYGLHALRASSCCCRKFFLQCFNPSYGLHALRAVQWSFNNGKVCLFQSLIWVACPTGWGCEPGCEPGCGFNPSYGLHALRAWFGQDALQPNCPSAEFQSLIWVACPTGPYDYLLKDTK